MRSAMVSPRTLSRDASKLSPASTRNACDSCAAGLDIDFAAHLANGGIVERQVEPGARPAAAEDEQVEVIIERVEADLGAGLEREAGKVGAGPVEPPDRLVALRFGALLEPAADDAVGPLERGVEGLAVAAVGERDELDRAAGQRPADVAAKLVAGRLGGQEQAVVAFGAAGREDAVGLDEILGVALEAAR